jgi:hypothetical protein
MFQSCLSRRLLNAFPYDFVLPLMPIIFPAGGGRLSNQLRKPGLSDRLSHYFRAACLPAKQKSETDRAFLRPSLWENLTV